MDVKFLYFYNNHQEWHCDVIEHSYDNGTTKQSVSVIKAKSDGKRPDFLGIYDEYTSKNSDGVHQPVCMVNEYGVMCLISKNGNVMALNDDNSTNVENQFKTHLTIPDFNTVKVFLG